jgi:Flp pilus assembly pilin Flp
VFNSPRFRNPLGRLWRDDSGAESLQVALIAGVIVVAALAVLGTVGAKLLARWTAPSGTV